MNINKYVSDSIVENLGEMAYQIWWCDAKIGTEKIFEYQGKSNVPPAYNWKRLGYYIMNFSNYMELHFCYPEESEIIVRLFHTRKSLDNSVMNHLYHSLHSHVLEYRLEMKQQEQHALIESIHSITSSLELDSVLKKIIRHALKVIPSGDAGYLMLYNSEKQKLVPKTFVGFNEIIKRFETSSGESITGKVFEDGIGRIYNSYEAILKGMHTHKVLPENFSHIHEASGHVEGALCVPVSFKTKRMGVMIIHQREMKKSLNEADLTLLEGFATQVAIAIENAHYHMEMKDRLKKITSLSHQLEEKNIQLQKRQDVHYTLTKLSLKNKGINLLIDGMKNMVEREIIFFNSLENTFYSPNKKNSVKFSIFEVKSLFSKHRMGFYVDVTTEETITCFVYPIYNDKIFLGCLIIPFEEPITDFDKITLEQGSTVLALEMVNRQTATKIYHRRVYEQFRELLTCSDTETLIQRGKEFQLSTSGLWMSIVLEIPKSTIDLHYLDITIHQLATRLNTELGEKERLLYGFYNKINLLVSVSNESEANDIMKALQGIQNDEKQREGTVFRGGVSSVHQGIESIDKCYEEANKTISYLASQNRLEIIRYEEIGLNKLFLNQPVEDIEHFIHENLGPILAENSKHSELEKTLFTYIDTNKSPGKTAKVLHIHINTFYQRLQSIEKLLNIDLNNSEDALNVQLACHLKRSQMAHEGR